MKKLVFLFIILCLLSACTQTEEVTEKEKVVLITVKDLAPYGITYSENNTGKYTQTKITNYLEVEYEYEYHKELGVTPLHFISSFEVDEDQAKGKKRFTLDIIANKGAAVTGGWTLEEKPGFVQLGDETFFALRKKNNETVGITVVVRRGNKNYNLFISGLYLDDKQLTELMQPKLAKLDEYGQ